MRKIHDAMRTEVPMDKRTDRLQWRNERLLNLAVHKINQDAWDQNSPPKKTDDAGAPKVFEPTPPAKEKAVIVGSGIVGR